MHHTFYISLPPRRLQQEIPSFHVYGGNKARKRFSVPFPKLANYLRWNKSNVD